MIGLLLIFSDRLDTNTVIDYQKTLHRYSIKTIQGILECFKRGIQPMPVYSAIWTEKIPRIQDGGIQEHSDNIKSGMFSPVLNPLKGELPRYWNR